MREELLAPGDIDPLGRHLNIGRHPQPVVQIALLAEDENVQNELATHGIATQTPKQVEPIQVRYASELLAVYTQIGRNQKLGISGRPTHLLQSLTTAIIFQIQGETIVFLPSFSDEQQFYLTLDFNFWVAQIKTEIAYSHYNWRGLGRPTITLLITNTMLSTGSDALLELMKDLKDGHCNGTAVKLGRLNQLMLTAGREKIDFLHEFEFNQSSVQDCAPVPQYLAYNPEKNQLLSPTQELKLECENNLGLLLSRLRYSENLYEQIELLQALMRLQGLDFNTGFAGSEQPVTVADLLNEVYLKASQSSHSKIPFSSRALERAKSKIAWAVVRRAAGLLNKVDMGLSDAVTDILVQQKEIMVGKSYTEASMITRPLPNAEIMDKIYNFCREDIRDRVLTQEIIIYLGLFIKSEPQLFKGLLTLRVGYLILLITSELASELQVTQDEAYERLMHLSPFEIKKRLGQVLAGYEELQQVVFQQEALHVNQHQQDIEWMVLSDSDESEPPVGGWLRKRQRDGAVNRVPKDFYPSVWRVMKHCKGLVIGDKLERRNRLDSNLILSEMTPGEKNFALLVEHLLNKIPASENRQINIEALMALAALVERNPKLQIEGYIVLEVVIGHAVRLAWLDPYLKEIFAQGGNIKGSQSARYDEHKVAAWRTFYESSPYVCASYVVIALQFLTELGETSEV